jgi:hypothetical protein
VGEEQAGDGIFGKSQVEQPAYYHCGKRSSGSTALWRSAVVSEVDSCAVPFDMLHAAVSLNTSWYFWQFRLSTSHHLRNSTPCA